MEERRRIIRDEVEGWKKKEGRVGGGEEGSILSLVHCTPRYENLSTVK